jgi:uncharacterized protein (UPF0335 family)
MLKAFVDRIERLHEERKALSDDIADIYKEAKGNGFDTKVLKIVIQRRAKDPSELTEQEALVEAYEAALGTKDANIERAPARPDADRDAA